MKKNDNELNDNKESIIKEFKKELHIGYLNKFLNNTISVPGFENNQMTQLYFIAGSLSMLNELSKDIKNKIVQYVISQMIINNNQKVKGFRASNFTGFSNNQEYLSIHKINTEDYSYLAATYSALSLLSICDIDLSSHQKLNSLLKDHYNEDIKFDPSEIFKEVSLCQNDDGSFQAQICNGEHDARFIYCALCIMKYLGLNTKEDMAKYINVTKCLEYLKSMSTYEGGYSMIEDGEANGGLTYCTIASFILLGIDPPNKHQLIQWLINRAYDDYGVSGRTNKIPDSCYSFWILGSLQLLNIIDLIDTDYIIKFILQCQSFYGGFSKHYNKDKKSKSTTFYPDLLHTFYSLSTLCLLKQLPRKQLNPLMVIPINV